MPTPPNLRCCTHPESQACPAPAVWARSALTLANPQHPESSVASNAQNLRLWPTSGLLGAFRPHPRHRQHPEPRTASDPRAYWARSAPHPRRPRTFAILGRFNTQNAGLRSTSLLLGAFGPHPQHRQHPVSGPRATPALLGAFSPHPRHRQHPESRAVRGPAFWARSALTFGTASTQKSLGLGLGVRRR